MSDDNLERAVVPALLGKLKAELGTRQLAAARPGITAVRRASLFLS